VADDHPAISHGIQFALGKQGIEVVKTLRCAEEIESAFSSLQPDVIVMEVRMCGKDALQPLELLKERHPQAKIVLYSALDNPSHIARAAALGCNDYILKTSSLEGLLAAIKTAAAGAPPPESSLLAKIRGKMKRSHAHRDPNIPLTNREMQVLQHVSMGLSNREVGKSLGISVETVKEHVQNILRKLDVNDRTQAAVWAVKQGLV
jgi:DNA-binding NarL/FixJ family response regulator